MSATLATGMALAIAGTNASNSGVNPEPGRARGKDTRFTPRATKHNGPAGSEALHSLT